MTTPQTSAQPAHAEYDSPWKEMLEGYFQEFLAFFFPDAHAGIDWTTPPEFLDKELQQIVRDAELGRRLVDKLVQVSTPDGQDTWVVVHVEVQGERDTEFARRMFVYYYRIFDRYARRVASLAVLADDRKTWRPRRFCAELWGCEARFTFPCVKLLDYATEEAALEAHPNPFALVTLAYLKARATRQAPEERLRWKIRLARLLYERGYDKQDILELMRFIDWVLVLPDSLEQQFDEAMLDYEEERHMRYVTSFERYGLKKGRQEGRREHAHEAVLEILEIRFEQVPDSIRTAVNAIDDLVVLQQLFRRAVTVESLEEFTALLERQRIPV